MSHSYSRFGASPLRGDALAPAAAVASLVVACAIYSSRRFLWTDELFAWTLVTDDSIPHLLSALADGADGAPPLYYLAAWVWVRVFGTGELALRLFSSLGFALAVVVVWALTRRAYGPRAAAVGALTVVASDWLLSQNAEARFYGLLMALCAVAVALFAAAARRRDVSARLLVGTAAAHAALVLTHVYGALYSGAIFAALLAWDATRRTWRPALYAAVVAGWSAFLLWLGPFGSQADLGRPHT